MSKEIIHNNESYWVTIEPTINPETNLTGFLVFISKSKPGLFLGELLRNNHGQIYFFGDERTALIYANDYINHS
jgi:hypothetical protein